MKLRADKHGPKERRRRKLVESQGASPSGWSAAPIVGHPAVDHELLKTPNAANVPPLREPFNFTTKRHMKTSMKKYVFSDLGGLVEPSPPGESEEEHEERSAVHFQLKYKR